MTSTPAPVIVVPILSLPPPAQAYPPMLQYMQADMPAVVPTFIPQYTTPLIPAPCDVLLPSVLMPATPAPVLHPPMTVHTFPLTPESLPPVQTDPITRHLMHLPKRLRLSRLASKRSSQPSRALSHVLRNPTPCIAKPSGASSAEVPRTLRRSAKRQTSISSPEGASAMCLGGLSFPQEQRYPGASRASASVRDSRSTTGSTWVSRQCRLTWRIWQYRGGWHLKT